MNKNKLTSAKKKLMKFAPAIATATGIIATVTSAVIVICIRQADEDKLLFTQEDQEMVKTKDVNMRYSVGGSDYALHYIGNTPK